MSVTNMFAVRSPDGRAEWRIVLDEFLKAGRGQVVSYEHLGRVLDRDPVDERHAIYAAAAKAARELRRTHSRSVGVVKGAGYRVLEASEHEVQAYGYHGQATRRMNTAVAVLRATPLDDLTPEQRRRTLAATAAISNMAAALNHVATQQRQQELVIDHMRDRMAVVEEKLGIGIDVSDPEHVISDAGDSQAELPSVDDQ